jgi:hypothetical protein
VPPFSLANRRPFLICTDADQRVIIQEKTTQRILEQKVAEKQDDGIEVGIGVSYSLRTPVNMVFFTLSLFEIASQADRNSCTSTDDAKSRHFLHGTFSILQLQK